MSSLIPASVDDGVEPYIVLERPIYEQESSSRVYALIRNLSSSSRELSVEVLEDDANRVLSRSVRVDGSSSIALGFDHATPSKPGVHSLSLLVNGKLRDRALYVVGDPSSRRPLYFTIVWHHHQAPNYDPDLRVHSPWAYVHTWQDELKPYGRGPYHFHAVVLSKYASFKSTYNLSPSLLRQWLMLIERGVVFTSGSALSSSSVEASIVADALNRYRDALRRGQIDVLTSIYAHTIGGFLVDYLGLSDIVRDEIEYGIKVTSEAMGSGYFPEGVWTPEMAFSMRLVPIYSDLGLKYTVLDEQYQFRPSIGAKGSPHRPYVLVDESSKKSITVFFRDTELSNVFGFKNYFVSEPHAWRNAYEFSYLIAKKWIDGSVETLVLALDGENWMIFSKNPPMTAYYMEKLVQHLISMDVAGYLKLSNLREMYRDVEARDKLTHVPTSSWLGGFSKWHGEIPEHRSMWRSVRELVDKLRAYERAIGSRDSHSERARWCIWHALDSDYWWAEFWSPDVIRMWMQQASSALESGLKALECSKRVPARDR